jgi:predicted nucleic acid-binding protein
MGKSVTVMRVVLDTNILVSALLIQVGHPAAIYHAWQEGAFTLVVCAEQRSAELQIPPLRSHGKPGQAG